ncbi:MAG: hypothetical protein GY749_43870 [Desulfobacteraceae bacterium]|nr:hypothetical protein [Desulfobacteraceae bacterium]
MIELKRDFIQRKEEINTYFLFLKQLLTYNSVRWNGNLEEKISLELRCIMKANIFLMLYNLAESSISAAIEQIHFSIKDDRISFDNVKEGIKTKLINNLKNKKNAKKFIEEINEISIDIVTSCFEKKDLFSGNVDSREIKNIANQYGFSTNSDYIKTKNGEKLKTVKDRRNELAHGDFSFQEIGKDYTLTDISDFKDEVIAYLEQIIDNIEIYINTKEYKM